MEDKTKIGKSKIQGKGLMAAMDVRAGRSLGESHINNWPNKAIGENYNHSETPNARNVDRGNKKYLVPLSDIKKGEEITVDYRTMPEMEQPGNFIFDKNGQWNHPGKKTAVPTQTGKITMKGVNQPVHGVDNLGNEQMMQPNGEYQFPGNIVYETPMQDGGGTPNQQAYDDSLSLFNWSKQNEAKFHMLTERNQRGDNELWNQHLTDADPMIDGPWDRLVNLNQSNPQPVSREYGTLTQQDGQEYNPSVKVYKEPVGGPGIKVKPKGTTDPNLSVDVRLRNMNMDPSYANRTRIASEAGIENYKGTADQNKLLNQYVQDSYSEDGKLKNQPISTEATPTTPVSDPNLIQSIFSPEYAEYKKLANRNKAIQEYDKWHQELQKAAPKTGREFDELAAKSDSLNFAKSYLPKLSKPTEAAYTFPSGNVITQKWDKTPVDNPYSVQFNPTPWGEDQAQGDAFRQWVNETYPQKAKEYKFDPTGAPDNDYARSAYYELGQDYENSKKETDTNDIPISLDMKKPEIVKPKAQPGTIKPGGYKMVWKQQPQTGTWYQDEVPLTPEEMETRRIGFSF